MHAAPSPASPNPAPLRCAEVHALTGSTPPGASQPFAVVTDGATPASTPAPATVADVERRLAEAGVTLARLFERTGLARSTWARWRAGGTRRSDRWCDVLEAVEILAHVAVPADPLCDADTPLAETSAAVQPDAEVIDLAERVRLLVPREVRLMLRVAGIEDAVMDALPPRPILAEGQLHPTN